MTSQKNRLSPTFCTLCQNNVSKKPMSYRVSVVDTPISQLRKGRKFACFFVPLARNFTMIPLLYVRQSVLTCQTSSYTYTENSIGRIYTTCSLFAQSYRFKLLVHMLYVKDTSIK